MAASSTPRLADRVYDEVRTSIISGGLRPNQRLVETEIAEQLELSRTPVREGLQRLAVDGLVRGERYGWVVHEHTLDEIHDIYETRAALEGYASRLAAERLTEDEIRHIDGIQGVIGDDWGRFSSDEIADINADFHRTILEGCRNERLLALIAKNREFYFNHRVASSYTAEDVAASMVGHQRIIEALTARDGARAEALVREHIHEGFEVIKSHHLGLTARR